MKNKILLSCLFLIVAFVVLCLAVSLRLLVGFDLFATKFIQAIIPTFFNFPLSIFSLLGSSEVTVSIIGLIFILGYLKYGRFMWGLGSIILVYLIEIAGKLFLYHPGPPREFFRYSIPFIFPSAFVHTSYSFPSGHVSRTLFLAVLFAFLLHFSPVLARNRKVLYLLIGSVSAIMVVSRVYLGEHWTSDVLGGILLGSFFGLITAVSMVKSK